MKSAFSLIRHPSFRRKGALALEWVLLITIVVIGVLGGLAAVRNATVKEITDGISSTPAASAIPSASSEYVMVTAVTRFAPASRYARICGP